MPGYGDAFAAVNEGIDADQNIINNYYHNQAQNALVQMYGPAAGNPQGALQMQQYNYLQSQDKQYLDQQAIANRQATTNLQYDQSNNPIRLQNNQGQANVSTAQGTTALQTQPSTAAATNATNTATAANVGPAAAAQTQQSQAKATQDTVAASAATGYMHVQATNAFTDFAQKALANGQDPEAAFNGGLNAARSAGATQSDLDALASQYHDQFVKDPAGTTAALSQAAQSAYNSRFSSMSPIDQANLRAKYLEYNQNKTKLIQDNQTIYNDARSKENELLQSAGPLGAQTSQIHSAQDALQQARAMIDNGEVSTNTLANKALAEVPGSAPNRFNHLMTVAEGALGLSQMSALRQAAGGSIGGIRNEAEFSAAGESLANFDLGLGSEKLKGQIANAQGYLDKAAVAAENTLAKNNADYRPLVAASRAARQNYLDSLNVTPDDIARVPNAPNASAVPDQSGSAPPPSTAPASSANATSAQGSAPARAIVFGDSLGVGVQSAYGYVGNSAVGRPPSDVLGAIKNAGDLTGHDVVISSGASNAPKDAPMAYAQIKAAIDKGADPSRITLLGVGTRSDFAGVNDELAQIAKQTGVKFQPIDPANVGKDGVHPANYKGLLGGGPSAQSSAPPAGGQPVSVPAIANAILGQESGNRSDVGNSVDGAVGPGQIMPSTFAAYAKPGERIDNPADNRAVSARILADYAQRYGGDPARVATAYFSGPGNVAPAGSPTPYLRNTKDGSGKYVADYVNDVLGRLGQPTSSPPLRSQSEPNYAQTTPSQPGTPAGRPDLGQSSTPQNTTRPELPASGNRSGAGTADMPRNIGPVGALPSNVVGPAMARASEDPASSPQLAAMQAQQQFRSQVAQVMDGRALLAKYLQPQKRTA